MTAGAILGWSAWSAVIAGLVAWVTARGTIQFNREKLQREFQLEFATEAALKALLNADKYKMRSFKRIKHHLPGFASDDDLRLHLIRAGAVCFAGEPGNDAAGDEMWGLLEKHRGEAFQ
jgi:hypothetical protein